MYRSRIIPALLLKDAGLVKTVRFKSPKYVGDPINAVRIFNDKEVDELMFLDISATPQSRRPPFELIEKIAGECFMPLGYGGGIRSIEDIKRILSLGVEKVVMNTKAVEDAEFVREAAGLFGSQSIVVSIDVKRTLFGGWEVFSHGGRKRTGLEPVGHAKKMEACGAGEIVVNSIDRDGTMQGYDLGVLKKISAAVNVPVITLGGAGSLAHLKEGIEAGGASASSAGSLFVFQGRHRAVLISYPSQSELSDLF